MDERSLSSRSSILESEAAPESYLFFFLSTFVSFYKWFVFSLPPSVSPSLPPSHPRLICSCFVCDWIFQESRPAEVLGLHKTQLPVPLPPAAVAAWRLFFVWLLFAFFVTFSVSFVCVLRIGWASFLLRSGGGDSLGFSGILGILRDSLDLIQDSSRRIQKPSKQKHQKTHPKERQQQHKFSEIHWRFLTPFCGFLEYSPSNIHRDSFPRRWFWDA